MTDSALDVIDLLRVAGFVDDGETREAIVRVPTTNSPVLGRGGGELRSFGGRVRMHLPGTTIYCTVGRRTTFLYHRREDKTIETIASLHTHALDELLVQLEQISAGAPT